MERGQIVAIIDDDDAVRDSLQFLLEVAGFWVATYYSANQFLAEGNPGQLRCLVVDQHMPEVTGLQFVSQLRTRGDDLPIALITGSPSADLIRRAGELGVSKVLEKPLADDVLLDFVGNPID